MRILPLPLWLLVTAQMEAAEAQQAQQFPVAIRKMPPDQGEKFYHEYSAFPVDDDDALLQHQQAFAAVLSARSVQQQSDNASLHDTFLPPFAPHFDTTQPQHRIPDEGWKGLSLVRRAAEALARLQSRQWSCPTGTSSCSSIGYPNSCCQNGETCMVITDTGLGPVGCCPAGSACSGTVSSCYDGNTACSSNIGGGCCIPGYICEGVGCVPSSSSTPTPSPTGVTTLTTTSTNIITGAAPSTVVVTVVVTITPSQSPQTSTTTQTQTATPSTSSGTESTTGSTDSGGVVPPVRPTSSGSDSSSGVNTYCPTGFYACVASAGGGCCQTGRDCHTTSCPPISMTTIVNTNGITVAVPATNVPAATTGSCANGWFLCGSDAGPVAGCCPSGYSCGTASCSMVTAGATASIAKSLPGQSLGTKRTTSRGGGAVGAAVVGAILSWLIL
ncbi:hypothetical protein QBC46DRAFT_370232 [Diplogelasinospora grovesii]|uniref:GPI anchored protein n=1 Tax=Diplogelasinospora grovesii TaxID=303347 RepID=A0AAN6NJC9_9PEZI|nr:hypothetical protein QBC46DRAFT_370232 [Diplogelasinospora grovesii]